MEYVRISLSLSHPSLASLSLSFAQLVSSVTRWLDYFPTFGRLHEQKLAQCHTKIAKVGPKFCQNRKYTLIKLPKTLKIFP